MANAQRGPGSPAWHYLGGMYNAFHGHGYCTGPGINGILDSGSPSSTAAAVPRYVNTLLDPESLTACAARSPTLIMTGFRSC